MLPWSSWCLPLNTSLAFQRLNVLSPVLGSITYLRLTIMCAGRICCPLGSSLYDISSKTSMSVNACISFCMDSRMALLSLCSMIFFIPLGSSVSSMANVCAVSMECLSSSPRFS